MNALDHNTGNDIDVNTAWHHIGRQTLMFTGAQNRVYGRDFVQFTVQGGGKAKHNVIVQLGTNDLYNVEIGRVARRTFEWKTAYVTRDVPAENLPRAIMEGYAAVYGD